MINLSGPWVKALDYYDKWAGNAEIVCFSAEYPHPQVRPLTLAEYRVAVGAGFILPSPDHQRLMSATETESDRVASLTAEGRTVGEEGDFVVVSPLGTRLHHGWRIVASEISSQGENDV